MTTTIDLDSYFQRIGYTGERQATLDTLCGLHDRHTAAIAFENLNPLLRWPVPLDLPALQQKMIHDGRGGYCYEQNLLFSHVLKALGFQVTGLAARVLWNAPEGAITARSHMLLRVDLGEGPYIADVGFGVLTLTGPLRLQPDVEQSTPHELFRLVRARGGFVMQAMLRGTWKPLYRFDLEEQFPPDYEVANWYVSTHPASRFINGLIAARPAPYRRYALFNNELTVHHLNGNSDRRVLANAAELRQTLQDTFGLTLPDAPELDAVLTRLLEGALGASDAHARRTNV